MLCSSRKNGLKNNKNEATLHTVGLKVFPVAHDCVSIGFRLKSAINHNFHAEKIVSSFFVCSAFSPFARCFQYIFCVFEWEKIVHGLQEVSSNEQRNLQDRTLNTSCSSRTAEPYPVQHTHRGQPVPLCLPCTAFSAFIHADKFNSILLLFVIFTVWHCFCIRCSNNSQRFCFPESFRSLPLE